MLAAAVDCATLNPLGIELEDDDLTGLMLLLADGDVGMEFAGFVPVDDVVPKLARFVRHRRAEQGGGPGVTLGPELFKDNTEPQLRAFINLLCGAVGDALPPDVLGFMLVMMQDNGIAQYGGSITRESAIGALRELADRLEANTTVERGS